MSETPNINIQLIQPLMKEFPLSADQLSAFSCLALQEYPVHTHLHMELIYVAEGSLSIKVGVSNYTLHAGAFTIINPFELHALYADGESNKTYILEINPDFYDPCREGTIFVSAYSLYQDAAKADFPKIQELLKKIFCLHLSAASRGTSEPIPFPVGTTDNDTEYEKILLRSLINYFELHFTSEYFLLSDHKENTLRDHSLQANRLKSILTYFYEHFPQKIQLQDIAEYTFVNRYHISHLVKSGIGYTFSELLQHIRIEKAELYLLGTDQPIHEIVFELGFSSYRYFSQHFKNLFHMTPTAYRKKYQTNTIRYKSISYLHPISASEMQMDLRQLSAGRPAQERIVENAPDNQLLSLETLFQEHSAGNRHEKCNRQSTAGTEMIDWPATHTLYDSPYLPAVLLSQMDRSVPEFLENYNRFFQMEVIQEKSAAADESLLSGLFHGLPGCLTPEGLRKSAFYLNEFLELFSGENTIVGPDCLISKSDAVICILLYHVPATTAELFQQDVAQPEDFDLLIRRIIDRSPQKRWTLDLTGATGSSAVLMELRSLNLELDAFSQWRRSGQPPGFDELFIASLNRASAPVSRFERIDSRDGRLLCTRHLNPFEIHCCVFHKI